MKAEELNQIPEEIFPKFVQDIIDNMCIGSTLSSSELGGVPLNTFWPICQIMKCIVTNIVEQKMTKEEVYETLSCIGTNRAAIVYEGVEFRKEELNKMLVREAIKETNHLTDFDWNVRIGVSSDKVLELNEILMTLHLHTTSSKDGRRNTFTLDMSKPQVDELLEILQAAQNKIAQCQVVKT
ncbi:unnamed protein product [Meganyctiphanes norvegica]|uniref:COMM domain-containing protein n=1 Tax=Meganyctiphanes norvegica TaxID=48144 RepID=A0AAV2Q276_MEGNR